VTNEGFLEHCLAETMTDFMLNSMYTSCEAALVLPHVLWCKAAEIDRHKNTRDNYCLSVGQAPDFKTCFAPYLIPCKPSSIALTLRHICHCCAPTRTFSTGVRVLARASCITWSREGWSLMVRLLPSGKVQTTMAEG